MSAREARLDPTSPGGILRRIRRELGLSNRTAFRSGRATLSRLEVHNTAPAFETVLGIYETVPLEHFRAYLDAHIRLRDDQQGTGAA